jgi:hypothetical protein
MESVGSTGLVLGVGAVVAAGVYRAGSDVKKLSLLSVGLAGVVVAVVMWLLYTDVNQLCTFVSGNKMVSLLLGSLVVAEVAMHAVVNNRLPTFF